MIKLDILMLLRRFDSLSFKSLCAIMKADRLVINTELNNLLNDNCIERSGIRRKYQYSISDKGMKFLVNHSIKEMLFNE